MYESLDIPMTLVKVRAPMLHPPTQQAFESTREFLMSSPSTTGIISMGEEMTVGILAACRECGRPVPDAISLVNIGDSPLMKFSVPSVTCVDVDFERQIQSAISVIKDNLADGYAGEMLNYTPTRLVERDSVRPANTIVSEAAPGITLACGQERVYHEAVTSSVS
jgi:DNA-binding LacI/PurR family transcriptional regulator